MTDSSVPCAQVRMDTLAADERRLRQVAGEVIAASEHASTETDISKAWRQAPDLRAALLAGDCLQLLWGKLFCLAPSNALMSPSPDHD